MKYFIILLVLSVCCNACLHLKRDTSEGVGTFNAPEIQVIDYKYIEFAFNEALSIEEYNNNRNNKGYLLISVEISNEGNILKVHNLEYRGLALNKKQEQIFKLNLIKYVKFKVPVFYKSLDTIETSIVFKVMGNAPAAARVLTCGK